MICATDHSTRHGRFKPPSFESLWDSSDTVYTGEGDGGPDRPCALAAASPPRRTACSFLHTGGLPAILAYPNPPRALAVAGALVAGSLTGWRRRLTGSKPSAMRRSACRRPCSQGNHARPRTQASPHKKGGWTHGPPAVGRRRPLVSSSAPSRQRCRSSTAARTPRTRGGLEQLVVDPARPVAGAPWQPGRPPPVRSRPHSHRNGPTITATELNRHSPPCRAQPHRVLTAPWAHHYSLSHPGAWASFRRRHRF